MRRAWPLVLAALAVVLAAAGPQAASAPDPTQADTDTDTDTDTGADDAGDPRFRACAEPVSAEAVRERLQAMAAHARARDVDAFEAAWPALQADVDCLDEVLTPSLAAGLHGAGYLHAAATRDPSAMAFALLAARSVPGTTLPDWVPIPADAEVAQAAPWEPVAVPDRLALFVDGVPARARPVDRPSLVQAVGPGAEVVWTAWLDAGDSLPPAWEAAPPPTVDPDGQALLERVTDLLAEGSYPAVVELAVPAAARYPELASSFRAAADLAIDQLERERVLPSFAERPVDAYPSSLPLRRGARRRGDEREGLLLGFDLGLPTGIRGEWKVGGSAVDGLGLRVGANAVLAGGASAYTGTDVGLYADWNLTRRWQLETQLGLFFDRFGSAYPNIGASVQYDPPSPLQIGAGLRVDTYGYVIPEANVGFLW